MTTDRLQSLMLTTDSNNSLQTVAENRTITYVSGAAATSGDNTLVVAPAAGVKIVLVYVSIQNTTATSTTAKLTNGAAGAEVERALLVAAGNERSRVYPEDARPKLTAATALILNLSGANSHNYSVGYYTE